MSSRVSAVSAAFVLGALGFACLAPPCVARAPRTIVVTSTIQAAVDAAQPGDTIVVPPGTYRESVLVTKSDLTIAGSRAAVIDAAGFRTGIRVGSGSIDRSGPVPTCPPIQVHGFRLAGLTIKHGAGSGAFLVGVDGYRLTGTRYVDNPVYGPFPVCSTHGLIELNQVVGGGSPVGPRLDTGIYVGDDDTVTVRHNSVTNYVVGVVAENSVNAVVEDNTLRGNTAGVYAIALPDHVRPFADNIRIEHNRVLANNLPNPVPADSGDDIGLVPTGAGVVSFGADHVVVRANTIIANDSFGVTIAQNFLASADPRMEPNSDFNEVRSNVVLRNGAHPDPIRAITPGADIVYDGTGVGTCFGRNVFATEFPVGVTAAFPCGDSR